MIRISSHQVQSSSSHILPVATPTSFTVSVSEQLYAKVKIKGSAQFESELRTHLVVREGQDRVASLPRESCVEGDGVLHRKQLVMEFL